MNGERIIGLDLERLTEELHFILGLLLRLSGDADHLAPALIPVQTSSKCLSNSGDTESGFWGEAGSGSF